MLTVTLIVPWSLEARHSYRPACVARTCTKYRLPTASAYTSSGSRTYPPSPSPSRDHRSRGTTRPSARQCTVALEPSSRFSLTDIRVNCSCSVLATFTSHNATSNKQMLLRCVSQNMSAIYSSFSILTAVFPDEPGLASFTEAKDDGSGGDNW